MNLTPTCNQLATDAETYCVPIELEPEIIDAVEVYAVRAGCTFDEAVETIIRRMLDTRSRL